ncbi:(2Fe-2S)-binding protein [Rhodopseudomonas sp. BR0M22]|uniref:(2Fe-2S)-binding protein n=1 Tax=Rhodopseudomonas sp. BR0M22 TaxID=2269369 RepID=UPI0013DFB388|nr:(2Fe-2S)-binding protein [Rhodopseudomonas sp. BR0M22]NEW93285.1 (2Fe-2S)-binding protein [Rhodopseudomonas sp. BR0M22]
MTAAGPVAFTVNGAVHSFDLPRDTRLIYVLRNDLGLNGPKFGCGLGECGACTVLIDGVAARSCVVTLKTVEGRSVTTLEGLGSLAALHPVQQAFIDAQAAQCGYCLNGMIMTAAAFLSRNQCPTEDQVRQALRYNLCRCGTHVEILRAVMAAAGAPGCDHAADSAQGGTP